jgi:copper homeostasis protein
MDKIILEAPVFTLEAAILAADFGIDRLELCADFGEGGTTPGAGMLAYLKSRVEIPIFVMIRPRGGDFVYSSDELEVMKKEITILKGLGADGFVFGILEPNGKVNIDANLSLIKMADGSPCTFHRAFDASSNLEESLEKIIDCGFRRILTSGGRKRIQLLLEKAGDRIIIMPGGGTTPEHLKPLASSGHLREVHSSCKAFRDSQSSYFNPDLQLSEGGAASEKVLTVDRFLVEAFQKELTLLERQ